MNFCTNIRKGRATKITAVLVAIALAMPLGGSVFFGQSPINSTVYADAVPTITFDNTGEGADLISMTDQRTFTASFDLAGSMNQQQVASLIKGNKLQWSLTREKGMQDEKMFPYQYLGGNLKDWKVWSTSFNEGKTNFFYDIKTAQSGTKVVLTFSNELMFGNTGVGDGDGDYELISNRILDYVGPYTLSCTDGKGKVLGAATVTINEYDSFRTYSEIESELTKAANAANKNGLYAEVQKFGLTAKGNDMKAIFIADSKKTLSDYQNLKKQAETDPGALINKIKAGTLEYKVPILYSNVHSDETPGSDANMNFIWDLANSKDGKITYSVVTGFTPDGKERLAYEMKNRGVVWSDLIKGDVTGLGFIRASEDMTGSPYDYVETTIKDMKKYYTIEDVTLDVKDLLKEVFFIVVPAENVDAKLMNVRENGNGFDLNRDNTFQTQPETKAMTKLIADWNPITFIELHGYVAGFQIEPCSPTHEPNIEYDLIAGGALRSGEAFGVAAIANNDKYNSFVMPLRDYLYANDDGTASWSAPWDDMSTSYTPQYSMLHGTVAFTIECPVGNEETVKALEYGLLNHGKYVMENKDALFLNQLAGYERGIENVDADSIRPWYVDINDKKGAEADIFRERYAENGKFFPEYYVIPADAASQEDTQSAYEMTNWLMRNGVTLKALNKDATIGGKTYKAGTFVVDMHQAKRNVANAALYDNVLIEHWTDLYSEPLTAFPKLRGFDCDVITEAGAFSAKDLNTLTEEPKGKTQVAGTEGNKVIISNNSVHAVSAVNNLLESGRSVGYITDGADKGDFVTTYNNFATIKDNYVLIAERTDKELTAKNIAAGAKIFVPGTPTQFSTTEGGQPYGVKDYDINNRYKWDVFAYQQQMGFDLVYDPKQADVIVGNIKPDEGTLDQVKKGTPYIAYSPKVLDAIKGLGIGFDWQAGYQNMEDATAKVEYVEPSMVTDKYVAEDDYIMYGYGGAKITKVPEGAKVLIKVSNEKPTEGFMLAENVKKYMGSVQAIEYEKGNYDVTVFANSLTNKAHQQDDYRYATNAIYSKLLGGDYSYTDFTFKDVKAGAWYAPYVAFVANENLFGGTGPATFEPNKDMTRGMFVTVLGRVKNEDKTAYANNFADVKKGAWYEQSVAWAADKNMVSGLGDNKFGPNNAITREQMCLMLVNYAKVQGIELTAAKEEAAFADSGSISTWAKASVEACQKAGLVSGKGEGKFDPKGTATRAEVSAIMANFVKNYVQ